jgi:hypothetical protein
MVPILTGMAEMLLSHFESKFAMAIEEFFYELHRFHRSYPFTDVFGEIREVRVTSPLCPEPRLCGPVPPL